jgi:hypothetical protein
MLGTIAKLMHHNVATPDVRSRTAKAVKTKKYQLRTDEKRPEQRSIQPVWGETYGSQDSPTLKTFVAQNTEKSRSTCILIGHSSIPQLRGSR